MKLNYLKGLFLIALVAFAQPSHAGGGKAALAAAIDDSQLTYFLTSDYVANCADEVCSLNPNGAPLLTKVPLQEGVGLMMTGALLCNDKDFMIGNFAWNLDSQEKMEYQTGLVTQATVDSKIASGSVASTANVRTVTICVKSSSVLN